jgi:uncharacterized glyoxalase superfamily protein PhnB
MQLTTHVNFDGNCKAACNFYAANRGTRYQFSAANPEVNWF